MLEHQVTQETKSVPKVLQYKSQLWFRNICTGCHENQIYTKNCKTNMPTKKRLLRITVKREMIEWLFEHEQTLTWVLIL